MTGSKSKRKHSNAQPGHPSLPQPVILLQSVHNLLSFLPKASRHNQLFLALPCKLGLPEGKLK